MNKKQEKKNASEDVEAHKVAVGTLLDKKARSRAASEPLKYGMDREISSEENTSTKRDKGGGKRSINYALDNSKTFTKVLRKSNRTHLYFRRKELDFCENRLKLKMKNRASKLVVGRAE